MSLSTRSLVLQKRILSCRGNISRVGSSTSFFGTISTTVDIISFPRGNYDSVMRNKLSLEGNGSNLSSMRLATSHGRRGGFLVKRCLSSGTMSEGENQESLQDLIMVRDLHPCTYLRTFLSNQLIPFEFFFSHA